MGSFYEDTLTQAADAVFLLPNREYVTYIPASGSQRRIKALIERYDETDKIANLDGGSSPALTVLVANSATSGISSDELDTGGDKMEIMPRDGKRPVTARITELLSHDAGWCRLQVQP